MNCQKAKKIDMVSYLKKLGFEPQKTRGYDKWYISPFRGEKIASFKINTNKNCWYDYGTGSRGTIIDFLQKFYRCSISEVLQKLSSDTFSFHQQPSFKHIYDTKINITSVIDIQHLGLIAYLNQRRIPLKIARKICKEVHYSNHSKEYFSIGVENISGGYDLRNKYFKSGSSPKDISLIQNGHNSLVVTEGMFDMLSLISLDSSILQKADLLILNSCSFASKLNAYADKYNTINLYLDQDETGRTITEKFVTKELNYHDCSSFYQGYNDLNEWWVEQK
ncbi:MULTISPECIES: toprim domain-containing protein [Zobellia]|uniref:Conjugative transposon proteinTraP n=1 Tax=Zobellia galactanivorans (strain DSM 12802 / CCUG 47099 / CIP 106680 / NCIMB 13871 / Dsij) TaxID=63186 RepID=G0LCD8_ZOBGA|nr:MULTISPECIES: toprim domain-containing protein [Zobellia]MDO6818934.1 toprim domain-containing protein [Zobellia sp. 1_MG-2023]CAZ96858.1 Conjugative transposon proteinTraP [Zobellia galactanivorans]